MHTNGTSVVGEVRLGMGKASRIFKSERRLGLYLLAALCVALGALFVGLSVLQSQGSPVKSVNKPDVVSSQTLSDEARVESQARMKGLAARQEAEAQAAQKEEKEAAVAQAPTEQAAPEQPAADRTAAQPEPAAPVAPADTTMSLSIPAIGLSDIPVFEGTGEDSLSQGVGHYTGTGYPWVPGSNTYIAGHRLGYPGTLSDHVFWNLPNLAVGDRIYLTDSNGTTYTYAVSDILEVPRTDLSVTGKVPGRDMVSLQTCIENFGDYWTPGPNWYVRYVVQADKVS
jgi:sortase A